MRRIAAARPSPARPAVPQQAPGGRQLALARVASAIGNRAMTRVLARKEPWEIGEDELPPGLDLSFLDEFDDPVPAPVVAAPVPVAPNLAPQFAALDGDRDISALVALTNQLLAQNLVVVGFSSPVSLGGKMKTAEVRITVSARAGGAVLAQFVAHYHHGAQAASTENRGASKMHFKRYTNADSKWNRSFSKEGDQNRLAPLERAVPGMGATRGARPGAGMLYR